MPYIGSQILGKYTQIFLENMNWEKMPKSWFPKQWMKQQIQAKFTLKLTKDHQQPRHHGQTFQAEAESPAVDLQETRLHNGN